MSSVFQGLGAALNNEANEVLRLGECLGPVTLSVANEGENPVAIQVSKLSDGALVPTDADTVVADEDTGYDGDTSELNFTGATLAEVPIVPGTVTIAPTAGVDSVDATDRDGDGKLYTSDVDEDFCGTIDYATGALELFYPAGKAPNTTNILANYTHQDESVVAGGVKSYKVGNNPPAETLIVKAVGLGGNSYVKCDGFISLDK